MQDRQSDEMYVPWNDGAEILGVKRNAFFYLVETKQIRAESGRGPRKGRYSLADIMAVKERRASEQPRRPYRTRPKLKPVTIDWLYAADIPACLQLDHKLYNEVYLAEAAQYQTWVTKNPNIAMAAYDASDRKTCYAYVSMLPLPEPLIFDVLRGNRQEIDIQASEIETYERPGAYTLLANSAAADPDRPYLLTTVIKQIMAEWLKRFPDRYVTKIYAQSVSRSGDIMAQHFFMAPRYDLASNAYVLDLARPGASKIIQRYQAALEAEARERHMSMPAELCWP